MDVEIESKQYFLLHLKDLFGCACVISDENKVLKQRWIYFFVLGADKHGGYAYQLDIPLVHLILSEKPINCIYSQEEGLWQQLEIIVNLDDPIDQGTPY